MNRPDIFCHMMTSLDGKIMGAYMETPEDSTAGNVFYDIAFGKEPYYRHQGWLCTSKRRGKRWRECLAPLPCKT